MRYQTLYQYALIGFAFLVMLGIGAFVYHELFPEYKKYQYAYEDLEKFRSTYTHEEPAPFSKGIKQILLPNPIEGPELIDRCISCHVAMDLPHFSPTQPALDVNDRQIYDLKGNPVLEPNPDYVWTRLEQRIAQLRSPDINEALAADHKESKVRERLKEADQLERLRTVEVEGKRISVEKVIQMHPLMPGEARPFEFHPMGEYGCTTCHSGNGRSLVAKRAHGPVYDGDYDPFYPTSKPQFTEVDPEKDPPFSRMYNNKPGHDLIFQTTPILAGPLIVANCVQCHQGSSASVKAALDKFSQLTAQKQEQIEALQNALENNQAALQALKRLRRLVQEKGREGAIDWLNDRLQDYRLSAEEIDAMEGQLAYLKEHEEAAFEIESSIEKIEGSHEIIARQEALQESKTFLNKVQRSQEPLKLAVENQEMDQGLSTTVDTMISGYQRGKELFISQACYACHRIAGYSRASVGPELTQEGNSYPWYVKESIVWPQADLPSSTMPNFRLDHDELADLMTFLMAQKGNKKAVSEIDYHIELSQWEKGAKMPWELPVAPTKIDNVRAGQLVFASEGCAACHKLQGFETNAYFKQPAQDQEWFYRLFPELIPGSALAKVVAEHSQEIDQRILMDESRNGVVEEIESQFPGLIEGFYTNFKFAARAGNEKDADRLRRVLLIYIQEYGLGRDIAPHLNWSGVFRDNEWLLGHFHNPPAYTAKSIMPVMPFDDSKFYMLNYMLHELGRKNRDALQEIWRVEGFNPPLAYELLCSSCHGPQRQGNGIISEWIYPIPKSLRNPLFLRNLTKERAIHSITHGVQGTPMPPWGETISPEELKDNAPVLTRTQIVQLVDWLYQGVPYDPRVETQEDYEKWHYMPSDIVDEMRREKQLLKPVPEQTANVSELVQDYFVEMPNPIPGVDKELFYIREKYYTPQNLDEARQFFMVNCATCHGNDGTGTGLRATSMVEAKPRMFTNIPWIRTRDDLRLLRSIKYGVPGTAMTPWGDQTTAEQRMQLVIFIRELTRSISLRGELEEILYDIFDSSIQVIEKARATEYKALEDVKANLKRVQEDLNALIEQDTTSEEKIGTLYAQSVKLEKTYARAQDRDALYQRLIQAIKDEKEIYASIGNQSIAANLSEEGIRLFFQLTQEQPLSYTFKDGQLKWVEKHTASDQALLQILDAQIGTYQNQIQVAKSKISSEEVGQSLQKLMGEQGVYINLRTKLVVQLADAAALRERQKKLYQQIQQELTSFSEYQALENRTAVD